MPFEKNAGGASPPAVAADAFGDRFDLSRLPLARPGTGYAVQKLDTDMLLDRRTGDFLPVRDAALDGLFESFDDAFAAAAEWICQQGVSPEDIPLAVVPAFRDHRLGRHVLIYGVLNRSP